MLKVNHPVVVDMTAGDPPGTKSINVIKTTCVLTKAIPLCYLLYVNGTGRSEFHCV